MKEEYLEAAQRFSQSNASTKSNSPTSSVEIINKEDATDTETITTPVNIPDELSRESPINFPREDYMSHCSAAGSTFSDVNATAEKISRLFIFPQTCPGYEVVGNVPNAENFPLWTPAGKNVFSNIEC